MRKNWTKKCSKCYVRGILWEVHDNWWLQHVFQCRSCISDGWKSVVQFFRWVLGAHFIHGKNPSQRWGWNLLSFFFWSSDSSISFADLFVDWWFLFTFYHGIHHRNVCFLFFFSAAPIQSHICLSHAGVGRQVWYLQHHRDGLHKVRGPRGPRDVQATQLQLYLRIPWEFCKKVTFLHNLPQFYLIFGFHVKTWGV